MAVAWLAGVPASAQQTGHADVGGLALSYDAAAWRVEAVGGQLRATCIRQQVCGDVALSGGASDEPSGKPMVECGEMAFGETASSRVTTSRVRLAGILLHMAAIDTGCRNLVPPRIVACIAHDGQLYRFDTGAHGCRRGPGNDSHHAVMGLLRGFSARRSAE